MRITGRVAKLAVSSALAVTGMLVGATGAGADEFPTKPINLVIPFGAGGANDLTARAFVGTATELLGQPMVVHIKPGGGGAIASEMVASAKPDGYTLLFGHSNCNTVLPIMEGRSKGPDDFEPVALINAPGAFYITQPDAPFKTFSEMVAWAKQNPGKVSYANTGTWSTSDFMWRRLEHTYGVKTRIVSYDGGGPALVALLGGHVQVALLSPPQSIAHLKAGKLRPLAFTGSRRHPDLPNLPTLKEQGYDFAMNSWKGVLAPKGTPRPIVEKLAGAIKKMTEQPQAVAMLRQMGDEFDVMGPDEFEKFWRAESQTYRELARIFKK